MFDYRAFYEIHLSVSADFLRVVQLSKYVVGLFSRSKARFVHIIIIDKYELWIIPKVHHYRKTWTVWKIIVSRFKALRSLSGCWPKTSLLQYLFVGLIFTWTLKAVSLTEIYFFAPAFSMCDIGVQIYHLFFRLPICQRFRLTLSLMYSYDSYECHTQVGLHFFSKYYVDHSVKDCSSAAIKDCIMLVVDISWPHAPWPGALGLNSLKSLKYEDNQDRY